MVRIAPFGARFGAAALLLAFGPASAQVTGHDPGAIPTIVPGATAAATLGARAARTYYADLDFGARFDGVTDATSAINTAIAQIRARGGGTLVLPAGPAVISGSGIVPKSFVHIIGAGRGATVLNCTGTACFTQPAGSQLVGASITDLTLQAGTGGTAATGISVTSMQKSEIGRIDYRGFTGGIFLDVEAATVTSFDDSVVGPNTVFNVVHDIYATGQAGCVKLAGQYGTSPPAPSQVVTINTFERVQCWNVTGTAIDIVKAADTNSFYDWLIAFGGNNAHGMRYSASLPGRSSLAGTSRVLWPANDGFQSVQSLEPTWVVAGDFRGALTLRRSSEDCHGR